MVFVEFARDRAEVAGASDGDDGVAWAEGRERVDRVDDVLSVEC